MNHYISLIFFLLTLNLFSARIIEITANNVELVLKRQSKLMVLFQNPECKHSQQYTQQYMKIDSEEQLGIVDCMQQKTLCTHLNLTLLPHLAILSENQIHQVNEWQFLVDRKIVDYQDERVISNRIVSNLKEKNYFVAVLEEEQMPVIDRVSKQAYPQVFYLNSQTTLHSTLTSFVGQKIGCWVFQKSQKSHQLLFNKFYCGNGYGSDELVKYLDNYLLGKIQSHLFTSDDPQPALQSSELQNMLNGTIGCTLVYFKSSKCSACKKSDVRIIKQILSQKESTKWKLVEFNIDREQFPIQLKLQRVPQLLQACPLGVRTLGKTFTYSNVQNFLYVKKDTDDISTPSQL